MTTSQLELIGAVRAAALEAKAAGELPGFLGALEAIRVEVLLAEKERPNGRPIGRDRLLTSSETARKIGMSVWWVRANKEALPIVRLPTGRYAFSEKGLERWIERRVAS